MNAVLYLFCIYSCRRFTSELASTAKSVVAVDFMEKFIERNKMNNARFSNIEYRCVDVTKLNLQNNRYFGNS